MKIRSELRRIIEYLLIKSLVGQTGTDLLEQRYQPMPWLGLNDGGRDSGSMSRLMAIETVLADRDIRNAVVLDIGSHVGFFSLKLAEKGFFVYGVDSVKDRVYLSFLSARKIQGQFNPIHLTVDRRTVDWLPNSDITLCLSVWHHWVRNFGLDEATAILVSVVRKTGRLMFFDSGEAEMGVRYKLPFREADDAPAYLEKYLSNLPGVQAVTRLGTHQAVAPKDKSDNRKDVLRTLFCVEMKSDQC